MFVCFEIHTEVRVGGGCNNVISGISFWILQERRGLGEKKVEKWSSQTTNTAVVKVGSSRFLYLFHVQIFVVSMKEK